MHVSKFANLGIMLPVLTLLLSTAACSESEEPAKDLEVRTISTNGTELILTDIVHEREHGEAIIRLHARTLGAEASDPVQIELSPTLLRAITETYELVVRVDDHELSGHWAKLIDASRQSGDFSVPLEHLRGIAARHSNEELLALVRDNAEAEYGIGRSASLDELLPVVVAASSYIEGELGEPALAVRYVLAKLALHAGAVTSELPSATTITAAGEQEANSCDNGCTCSGGGLCGVCCDSDESAVCDLDIQGYCYCECESSGGTDCIGSDCVDHKS